VFLFFFLLFDSRQKLRFFLLATASRLTLRPTQPLSNGYQGHFPCG